MSMSSALANAFSLERQRARFRSARINNDEEPAADQRAPSLSPQTTTTTTVTRRSLRRGGGLSTTTTVETASPETTRNNTTNSAAAAAAESTDDDDDLEATPTTTSPNTMMMNDVEVGGASSTIISNPIVFSPPRTTSLTLAELEEERELARRRSSLCILLASFVLFRLWVSAIQEGDFGLMMLCLVGTSWTARWISYNREREEELDRRIAHYLENNNNNNEGGDPTLERSELRMLSFQAQLALAIMESQRQMMQGGYGHPNGGETQAGVSEEARARWMHLKFRASDEATSHSANKEGYGSVTQKVKDSLDDGPHCSICLSEYEEGEDIVKLPCSHLYHDECISSWTSNHVKCPLCNYDLESDVAASAESAEIV